MAAANDQNSRLVIHKVELTSAPVDPVHYRTDDPRSAHLPRHCMDMHSAMNNGDPSSRTFSGKSLSLSMLVNTVHAFQVPSAVGTSEVADAIIDKLGALVT